MKRRLLQLDQPQKNGVKKFTEWSVKPKTLPGSLKKKMRRFAISRYKSWALDSFSVAKCSKF